MRSLVVVMSVVVAGCGSKPPPPAGKPQVQNTAPVATDHEPAKKYDERVTVLDSIDPADPRTIDAALRAANSLAADKAAVGIDELIKVATIASDKRLLSVQVAAIRALGKYPASDKIVSTLAILVGRDGPKAPEHDPDDDSGTAMAFASGEQFALELAIKGAAINSLSELRSPNAVTTLVEQLYKTPELSNQLRRALVAIGPAAEQELVRVMKGEDADVDKVIKEDHLEKTSARDFYAAIVLGDFRDPATVPVLLAALKRPPLPPYADAQVTQYNAIFDALRKIGAADAAAPVFEIWSKNGDPKVAAPAISAYAFLTRDGAGVDELGKIAADNTADDSLRIEAAAAFARLAHDDKAIALMQALAKRYLDASAKKRKEAEPHRKAAEAADRAFAPKKKALEEAKAAALAVTKDPKKTVGEIKAAVAAAKKAEDEFKIAKKKHREQAMPFKSLDKAAKDYLGYARMFQTHIARIEVAIRCKQDLACYAGTLKANEAAAAGSVKKWIPDVARWKPDEKRELLAAEVDRAMCELGKAGAKASDLTDALLEAVGTEQPQIREAVLLALPKIAPAPCPACIAKLDAAVQAGTKDEATAELRIETELVRAYFR